MNEGYSELDLCPVCLQVAMVSRQDENENQHGYCRSCGYDTSSDQKLQEFEDPRMFPGEEEPVEGWPGDGSGMDDLADYNQMEADDYRNE